jgi:hypothetical protein
MRTSVALVVANTALIGAAVLVWADTSTLFERDPSVVNALRHVATQPATDDQATFRPRSAPQRRRPVVHKRARPIRQPSRQLP